MLRKVLMAAAFCALTGAASSAQSRYYVVTNDDSTSNSATVFNLNTSNGSMSQVAVLETGGQAEQGGYFAGVTQAISPGAACVFVADGGSSDIAAFSKATGYKKVNNYGNPKLQAGDSMPMLESSDGTLLYAAYATTSNLVVWNIDSDCSLSIANIYSTPFLLGSMAITHDGGTLLVTYEVIKKAGSWSISGSALTNQGTVAAIADVSGIAATNDGTTVIMGTAYNASHPGTVVTASLPGFTNQTAWTPGPGYSAGSLVLSAAAAAGSGCLYIGNTGGGSTGQAGVTGVKFTETPLNLTYVNNVTSSLATYVGNVATIGNSGNGLGVYAAENPGYVGVYAAGSDCSVRLVKETLDPQSSSLISLSAWIQ